MKTTIEINKASAVKAYNSADENGKVLLSNLLGKEHFGNIIDRMFTVKEACQEMGKDFDKLYENITDPYKIAEINIETFAEALREGIPASECLYYPWFDHWGGGFSCNDCGYVGTGSAIGSRLRVDTPEKAKHLGKCLLEDYKVYITGESI
jgi:hypothetical protein